MVDWKKTAGRVAETVADIATPWFLSSGGLNSNEEAELARIRALGDADFQRRAQLRATEPAVPKGNMAKYGELASRAAKATVRYAPAVIDKAEQALAKVSGGKVSKVTDLAGYVGSNPARLKVASEALLRSGIMLGDVLPRDLIGNDVQLMQIRQSAESLVKGLQGQYLQGSDRTLAQGQAAIAADVLRKKRVKAALSVYGSAETYFLCHPNGGIPAEDFAWYQAVGR